MNGNIRGPAIALVAAALCGCAGMTFHGGDGAETGIKFYTAKPYVLVSGTEAKVIYLPDLQNPVYAKPHAGMGMANYTLALNDGGMMTSFNQQTDSKISELLTAVGGLRSLNFDAGGSQPSAPFALYEVVMKGSETRLVPADTSLVKKR